MQRAPPAMSSTSTKSAPYLPSVEHDIFISYKHADVAGENDPWMDMLYKCLERELVKRLGRISMFRDNIVLQCGDRWKEELKRTVAASPVFLAVLSEPYFSSEVCAAEWDLFMSRLQAAGKQAGKEGKDGVGRMFPIMRLPFKHSVLDAEGIQCEPFYEGSPPRELSPYLVDQPDSSFFEAVLGLAQSMYLYLRSLKGDLSKQGMPVYLATVDALHDDNRRTALARDLQSRPDLRLLPDQPYFWSSSEHAGVMARHLDAASLSVFVVQTAGDELVTERTATQLTLAIACAQRKKAAKPMVWIPADAAPSEAALGLIQRLRGELAGSIELFDGQNVEDFKTGVDEVLQGLQAQWAAMNKPSVATGKVAVLMSEEDLEASKPLVQALSERFKREVRRYVVSAAKPLSSQADKIAACEAAFVVWGQCDEDWVMDALGDPACQKLREQGALAAFLADPVDALKGTFEQPKVMALRTEALDAGLGEFFAQQRTAS
jgi:hypothetical protein